MRKARVQVRFTAGERTESSCVQSAQGSYVIVWGLPFRDLGGGGICLLGVWYRLFSILLHRHGLCMVFSIAHVLSHNASDKNHYDTYKMVYREFPFNVNSEDTVC